MVEEDRKTNLTESEIVKETPNKLLPTNSLPRGLPGEYRDVVRTGDDAPGGNPGEGGDLNPPKNIKIKSQTIKFGPDGTQFVDVVVEFDEVDGASNYDVRITKE